MASKTAQRNGEGVAGIYENLFSSYNAWLDRAQETQERVADAFLASLESGLQRQRDGYKQAEDYADRLVKLQREWADELAKQFREYQAQAAEQYRTALRGALDAWTETATSQLESLAGRIQALSDQVETIGNKAKESADTTSTEA